MILPLVMDDCGKEQTGPGCNEYRAEMFLLALQRRLECEDLYERERQRIFAEIGVLERRLGLV